MEEFNAQELKGIVMPDVRIIYCDLRTGYVHNHRIMHGDCS